MAALFKAPTPKAGGNGAAAPLGVPAATFAHALARLRAQTLHVRVIEAHDLPPSRAAHKPWTWIRSEQLVSVRAAWQGAVSETPRVKILRATSSYSGGVRRAAAAVAGRTASWGGYVLSFPATAVEAVVGQSLNLTVLVDGRLRCSLKLAGVGLPTEAQRPQSHAIGEGGGAEGCAGVLVVQPWLEWLVVPGGI